MTRSFEDKVAMVTGGSSGIGRSAAMAFAREGAKVVIAAEKDIAGGNEVVQAIRQAGGEAAFYRTDVSRAVEVEALVSQTVKLYGQLDFAFNNAGVSGSHLKTAECTETDWDNTININLKGIWLCMKNEILWMAEHGGGVIVNMASVLGMKPVPDNADYIASKSGIIGLTKAAALEYSRAGIRINVVCPGIIDTRMTRTTFMQQPGFNAFLDQTIPQGRLGTSEEVAAAVLWLCSDAASFITGVALPVDGGSVLY